MKRFYKGMAIFAFLFYASFSFAQNLNLDSLQTVREEFYFEIALSSPKQLFELNQLVSIDQVKGNRCIAYANPGQFLTLLEAGYKPVLLLPPSFENMEQPMRGIEDLRQINDWDFYPTYAAYEAMMMEFQANYPTLCSIHEIGTLSSGRKLIAARINNGNPVGKPEFFYTSSMHGDEITGYILMLRLIDHLLGHYGTDPAITDLIDNLDIWINPLANPDGTYYGGNNTVNGSRRGNSNNVDLNRNYPDPEDGQHPDGNAWQPETVLFMNFASQRNFVMSANFHGGAEVANYPWDTWSRRHADDNWWIFVSREYADTIHVYSPSGYFTDLQNGITNGYDWYSISGGRQDYMNYYHQCREITMEISNTKLPPASQLPAFWNYNYRSLLNYMKQATYGFQGIITDSVTGEPILAKVEIIGHDLDNSFVYNTLPGGNFLRPAKSGTYNLTFSAEGYYPKTISSLSISDRQKVNLDVELVPGSVIADFTANTYEVAKGGQINFYDGSFGQNIVSWQWQFEGAVQQTSSSQNPTGITYLNAGTFDVQLTVTNTNGQSSTILKQDLINVTSMYVMTNGTFTTCEGTFFDPGGSNNDYGNNQDMIMTFIPDAEEALTKVEFIMFDLEAHSNCDYDWLKIYNGITTNAPLLGTWCGTNSPGTIIANNPDKGLTFHFHSDGSVTRSGWSASVSCFSTVSIDEKKSVAVSIYPNPAQTGSIQIQSEIFMTGLRLRDASGRILIERTINSQKFYQLQTDMLEKGAYIIEIETINGISTQKLIFN
ncbi:MAG: hypothetical protein CVT92_01550 [Bacteroidetes bacterium HGW-Bacteroidetes-1]|jgi:PKD repeat protein|nr:MAG: hypothetical protein CVT92_01550 [Bacteroidetes bacterium HGW-Bacteroidetes-1]